AFVALLDEGRLEQARLGDKSNAEATQQFITQWKTGQFQFFDLQPFRERGAEPVLETLKQRLLDGNDALEVNCSLAWLPSGADTVCKKASNVESGEQCFSQQSLNFTEGPLVTSKDKQLIAELSLLVAGANTANRIITSFDKWPLTMSIKSIRLLMDMNLLGV